MSEFKFNCPACGQHILAKTEWSGRFINCPSCNARLAIPSPGKAAKGRSPKPAPGLAANRIPSGRPQAVPRTATPPPSKTATAPEAAPAAPATRSKPRAPKTPSGPRIPVLSPAVKLDLVRAVRRRISDQSNWLPGKVNARTAYAAVMHEGKTVLLDVRNPEASRFSLIGAFLLEMHQRRVVRTAVGRKAFLDEEIPEAISDVLEEQPALERGRNSEGRKDLLSISHAQCLAALDALEERYSQRMDKLRLERAKRKLGPARLPDLVKKLEKKARITPEDVATVLCHELVEVRQRLERLEGRGAADSGNT